MGGSTLCATLTGLRDDSWLAKHHFRVGLEETSIRLKSARDHSAPKPWASSNPLRPRTERKTQAEPGCAFRPSQHVRLLLPSDITAPEPLASGLWTWTRSHTIGSPKSQAGPNPSPSSHSADADQTRGRAGLRNSGSRFLQQIRRVPSRVCLSPGGSPHRQTRGRCRAAANHRACSICCCICVWQPLPLLSRQPSNTASLVLLIRTDVCAEKL